jgi:hypothetical protein
MSIPRGLTFRNSKGLKPYELTHGTLEDQKKSKEEELTLDVWQSLC